MKRKIYFISRNWDTETPSFIEGSHINIGTQAVQDLHVSDVESEEDERPTDASILADRPSLLRQQEDSSTLQSTFREGSSSDPPVLDVSNIAKKWPDPFFCTRCGWIGQGIVQK